MSNMSYCRFENTSRDLRDCVEALEELANDVVAQPLSASERQSADWMVNLCRRYLEAHSMVAAADGEGEG